MGRPKIIIDKETFEKLCRIQCTEVEICAWFMCSDETLNKWCKKTYHRTFHEISSVLREGGKISLRRAQWNLAQANPSMAIFLGKNYLGQCDDPRKYQKDETTEDKLDKFLDTLTTAFADNEVDDGDDDSDEAQ